jgi:hypothetical protein
VRPEPVPEAAPGLRRVPGLPERPERPHRRSRGGGGRRGVGHLLALLADVADHGVDRHGDAFADDDLDQRALEEALDLEVGLVGLDLEEDVALGDGITLVLHPLDDGAFLHRLSQFRENDCLSH